LHSVEYGTKNIIFKIERKASFKNTYINIDSNGVVVKTNSRTTIEDINKMVLNKSAWITKKLELFKRVAIKRDINTGSRLYYMGRSYYVNMVKAETITINFTHSKFLITTPLKYNNIELNSAIEYFYKQKAIEKILPLTNKWAKAMVVEPEHISFRYSKNRWGSCSSRNRISFNYHLIKLPSSLIEYVVIHELAHITFKNHSKDFWNLIYQYLPDYKKREEKLRIFEKLI
jgi:hypothetical protein